MKKVILTRSHVSALFVAVVCAAAAVLATPASAGGREIKLATPEVALKACQAHKVDQWVLAYFIGKDGIVQWGWGNKYDCKQAPVPGTVSGVGDAIDSNGSVAHLANPDDALKACQSHQIGEWDIAYFNGKNGIAQWGWGKGYDCKQGPVSGSVSGVGNAIVK